MRSLLLIVCLGLVAGCAATGPAFTPVITAQTGEGVIYVYRPPRVANSGGYPQITVDGKEIGALKDGGYLAFRVPAGERVVEQQFSIWNWPMRAAPVKIDVEPGKSYFIRLRTDAAAGTAGAMITTTRWIKEFTQVDETTGWAEIKTLSLSE